MKIGSLFDGSGGFPLAATLCGMEPVWASEVEPYAIAVTRSRFPDMIHLGDVSKIDGSKIPPVHTITFGSPCQDMSIAGKREGIKHTANGDDETTRSGLFMEAVRIIREMRQATNGVYPRFAVWENVFGAFSSNRGEDFRLVLQSLIEIVEPTAVVPAVPKGGWAYADCWMGDGWSVGWRTFDAQYWGVPQRRRRIYLVADFGGECAGQVLFERAGLRGHLAEGGAPWQRAAADTERGTDADDRNAGCLNTWDNQSKRIFPPDAQYQTLDAADRRAVAYCMTTGTYTQMLREQSPTLMARDYKDPPVVNETEPEYIVRRLTPAECARLQGFPDKWGHPDHKDDFIDDEYQFWLDVRNTHAAINGKAERKYTKEQMLAWYNKLHTDSAEYRMWGNGIALPCALYVMQGIEEVLRDA